jgi:hypothetical protein
MLSPLINNGVYEPCLFGSFYRCAATSFKRANANYENPRSAFGSRRIDNRFNLEDAICRETQDWNLRLGVASPVKALPEIPISELGTGC